MEKWDILLSFQYIFTKIGGHLLTDIFHRLAKRKWIFFVCLSWFIYSLKMKTWDISSVFNISLPNLADIFHWSYLTYWPEQKFNSLSVSLSVGSFVDILYNYKYRSSLLMELIETFNICLSHYFSADGHFSVMMMMIVTVRMI